MSNKNNGFVRQITIKEMRSRFYRTMCRELAAGRNTPTPDTGDIRQEARSNLQLRVEHEDEDMSLGDPTEHYRIPKTHSSSQDLGEWSHQNRDDPALRVSFGALGFCFNLCKKHCDRIFDVAS
jgi:hypothetical protein